MPNPFKIMILVLHHLPEPAKVLAEVRRVLEPGGRLLVVDMLPHERAEYQQEMGHVWLGFDEDRLGKFLASAGLRLTRFSVLPPDAHAMGPTLFAATVAFEQLHFPQLFYPLAPAETAQGRVSASRVESFLKFREIGKVTKLK